MSDNNVIDTFQVNENSINGLQLPNSGATSSSGKLVEFYGTVRSGNQGSLFVWDFDDGLNSTPANPNIIVTTDPLLVVTHLFTLIKKYAVRLIEKRKDGIIFETVKTIKVLD